ncbi:pyridoxamine 5'-phosphate oxidase family protein [Methanobacterium aggregans]|uniref:pyridoxamine 5'-phosphate oxidase family protein n=1 Tax=Methanobacterium aggregans TaxID=1615586 RepID=UPI001AE11154|nr:pyridoxamine 5'-phosphate oxidase family protein [Methanobacterium aggregans]MBP2045998.1 putative pyridoxine 5'-phosphate oxidase superfamily flavin-nucleotide-binding protein [Methanobacterium aggregans]
MVMTDEMMKAVENDLVFLATSTQDGVPNVVPIGFAKPLDSKSILIVDNYMHKTHENLEKNPEAALVVKDAKKCPYQFKGKVEIFESGKIFDEAVEWATNVMTKLQPKAAILMKVEEIYSVQPGPDAGKQVD